MEELQDLYQIWSAQIGQSFLYKERLYIFVGFMPYKTNGGFCHYVDSLIMRDEVNKMCQIIHYSHFFSFLN